MASPPFASAFVTKLGTSYSPLDEEIVQIQELLVEPSSRLKRLDDQIADLYRAIAKLNEEHNRLGAYVDAHRALISPMRRLPLDVLQEIFVACMPKDRNCVMSAREAPVLLGRICSSWRTISLSTPRLWSRLHIAEPTLPFRNFQGHNELVQYSNKLAQRVEVTKIWLGRSGQCPLSVSVESSDHGPIQTAPLGRPNSRLILEALIPFAPRWQHMRLNAPLSTLETLFVLSENDVPMLRTFEMFQRPEGSIQNAQATASFGLLRGRNISSVTLHGVDINPRNFPVLWDRLTALSLMGRGWTDGSSLTSSVALEILSMCPLLRTCHIFLNNDPPPGHFSPFVELRSLRSLHIVSGISQSSTLRQMFSRLSLPELRHFDFRGRSDSDGEVSFASLLATSPRFESLRIETDSLTKTTLLSLLRGLPPTTHTLRIADTINIWGAPGMDIIDDDFIEALTPSPGHPAASCPRLRELHITQCSGGLSDTALLYFIMSRMTVELPPTLKRVNIHFNREMQVDIQPAIQPFLDGGLEVLTTYLKPEVWCSPWQGLPDAPTGH
ncbi:hypothetical protein FB451DRAFT_1207089 [Mycena latifolia]|nr:hypothetical protein FB451DRAFT_1207089 [Mycena latifolia]